MQTVILLEAIDILSTKYNKPIDFEGALTYPLFSVPLSFAYPDVVKRRISKKQVTASTDAKYSKFE